MTASRSEATFGFCLYLGAGDLIDRDSLASPPDHGPAPRIVIVEADPARLRKLGTEIGDAPHVEFIHAALAQEDGESDLRVFNIPGISSLSSPTELMDLYPGARVIRQPVVPTITAASLKARIGDIPSPARLCADMPGAEAGWLEALQDDGWLQGFDRIDLRSSADSVFEGGQTMAGLSAVLAAQGFEVDATEQQDPDWPISHFTLDRRALALAEAQSEIATLRDGLKAAEAANETLRYQHETSKADVAERDARLQALKGDLETAQKATASKQAEFDELGKKADWRSKRMKELEAERDSQQQQVTDRDSRIASLEAERDTLASEQATLKAALDSARADAAKADERAEATAGELANYKAYVADRDNRIETLRSELETKQAEFDELGKKADWRSKRMKELEAERDTLASEQATLKAALDSARADAAKADERAEATAGELASYKTYVADRDTRLKTLQGELETVRTAVEAKQAEFDELGKKADWRSKRMKELEAERDTLQAELDSKQEEIQSLSQKADAQAKHIQTVDAEKETLTAQQETLRKEVQASKAAAERAKTDLSLALRMQTIGVNDLHELQKTHASLLTQKQKQDDLIAQLVTRLEEASQYLQTLSLQEAPAGLAEDSLAEDSLPGDVMEAAPAAPLPKAAPKRAPSAKRKTPAKTTRKTPPSPTDKPSSSPSAAATGRKKK